MLLFSRNTGSGNVNLRVAVTPRGPTLHFRVEGYSLCKDIVKAQRRPRGKGGQGFEKAPLLVMNNFMTPDEGGESNGEKKRIPKHLESLTTTVFQSLFPPINPTTTPLKNIKRVLLLDRSTTPVSATDSDSASYVLNLRHYTIETRTAKSVPKSLRRLDDAEKLKGQKRKRGGLPDLRKLDDVADYLLDPHAADGFTSGSESEPETDAEVEVLAPTTQNVPSRRKKERNNKENPTHDRRDPDAAPNVQKKGIKLHELGPRLKLRLTKVEEGLCGGKVMWHEYISKSAAEEREMEKVHERRRQEKERRKAEQRENVQRKRAERKAKGGEAEGDEEVEDEEMEEDGELEDAVEEDEEIEDGGVEVG